jgi:hypothetical protein
MKMTQVTYHYSLYLSQKNNYTFITIPFFPPFSRLNRFQINLRTTRRKEQRIRNKAKWERQSCETERRSCVYPCKLAVKICKNKYSAGKRRRTILAHYKRIQTYVMWSPVHIIQIVNILRYACNLQRRDNKSAKLFSFWIFVSENYATQSAHVWFIPAGKHQWHVTRTRRM